MWVLLLVLLLILWARILVLVLVLVLLLLPEALGPVGEAGRRARWTAMSGVLSVPKSNSIPGGIGIWWWYPGIDAAGGAVTRCRARVLEAESRLGITDVGCLDSRTITGCDIGEKPARRRGEAKKGKKDATLMVSPESHTKSNSEATHSTLRCCVCVFRWQLTWYTSVSVCAM